MMVFRFFVILCLIFVNTNIMSQINFQHFYMYDKSSDPDDKKYDYGIMEIENKKQNNNYFIIYEANKKVHTYSGHPNEIFNDLLKTYKEMEKVNE